MVGMISAPVQPGTDASRSLSAYEFAVTMTTTVGFTKKELRALREADAQNKLVYQQAADAINEASTRTSALTDLETRVSDARTVLAKEKRDSKNEAEVRSARIEGDQRRLAGDRTAFDTARARKVKELDDREQAVKVREDKAVAIERGNASDAALLEARKNKLLGAAKRINDRQRQLKEIVGGMIEV